MSKRNGNRPSMAPPVACRRLSRGAGAGRWEGWDARGIEAHPGWAGLALAYPELEMQHAERTARTGLLGAIPAHGSPVARQSTTATWESREPPGSAARPAASSTHPSKHPKHQIRPSTPDPGGSTSPEQSRRAASGPARQGTVDVDDGVPPCSHEQNSASRARYVGRVPEAAIMVPAGQLHCTLHCTLHPAR
ncbi:hypothetical protein G7Z17_g5331 [Cylindrodendrum hubeiense]|uniref:Uncharacterized protein n=1 Tax=Cylindrodendrum hubeiense TaxID=595255 RepID=A0A9P5LHY7_9HYPO|nr:hypothetical protein G7Z17_g5331 [Cylindrodendrum hubeiense]